MSSGPVGIKRRRQSMSNSSTVDALVGSPPGAFGSMDNERSKGRDGTGNGTVGSAPGGTSAGSVHLVTSPQQFSGACPKRKAGFTIEQNTLSGSKVTLKFPGISRKGGSVSQAQAGGSNLYKIYNQNSLGAIVRQYCRQQHRNCNHPVATVPEFSLFKPHRCARATHLLDAPKCVTSRLLGGRESMGGSGGAGGNMYMRQLVHSRLRPWRTHRPYEHASMTAATRSRTLARSCHFMLDQTRESMDSLDFLTISSISI